MIMKKNKFSLEEHREMGARLRAIRNELMELSLQIDNGYPQDISDKIYVAVKRIDKVRSYLDDQVCKDYAYLDDKDLLSIYY